jgi:uncharacterized protein (DUF1778 family)
MARTARIELRAEPEREERIRYAATLAHQSVSSFVLDAAADRADELIAALSVTVVPDEFFETLLDALERPPVMNEALARHARQTSGQRLAQRDTRRAPRSSRTRRVPARPGPRRRTAVGRVDPGRVGERDRCGPSRRRPHHRRQRRRLLRTPRLRRQPRRRPPPRPEGQRHRSQPHHVRSTQAPGSTPTRSAHPPLLGAKPRCKPVCPTRSTSDESSLVAHAHLDRATVTVSESRHLHRSAPGQLRQHI